VALAAVDAPTIAIDAKAAITKRFSNFIWQPSIERGLNTRIDKLKLM
jgi:hypothetical protein